MTYIINKTNGELLKVLEEGSIDYESVSNIGLIGKLTASYGQCQSENFVHIAENFANVTPPESPLLGMTYYNMGDNSLYICTNISPISWTKMTTMLFKKTLNAVDGELYYDLDNKVLYIYDNSAKNENCDGWVAIGPDNYLNHKTYSTVLTMGGGIEEVLYNQIEFDRNTANLITIKIVGREDISDLSQDSDRDADCYSCIHKCMIESRYRNDMDYVKIIGTPTTEIIARTDGTDLWKSTVGVNDNKLLLTINACTEDVNTEIKWEVEIEVLKV